MYNSKEFHYLILWRPAAGPSNTKTRSCSSTHNLITNFIITNVITNLTKKINELVKRVCSLSFLYSYFALGVYTRKIHEYFINNPYVLVHVEECTLVHRTYSYEVIYFLFLTSCMMEFYWKLWCKKELAFWFPQHWQEWSITSAG